MCSISGEMIMDMLSKMDTKEYLKNAMNLEALIYEQSRIVENVKRTIYELEHPGLKKTIELEGISRFGVLGALGWLIVASAYFAFLAVVLLLGLSLMSHIFNFPYVLEWVIAFLAGGTWEDGEMASLVIRGLLIGVLSATLMGSWTRISETKRIKKKNEDIITKNENIIANNKLLVQMGQNKSDALMPYYDEACANLLKTKEIRAQFYAQNIIHEKYRNFVAVSMLYQYFDTGICTELEGHGGAYDRYEIDCKLDAFIEKLDIIIEKLDDISNMQYVLYQKINDINNNISKINSGLKQLQKTADKNLTCAEISSYNTTVMKNIMVYERFF